MSSFILTLLRHSDILMVTPSQRYVTTFAGWFLALVTNPLLSAHLTLGQLLGVGAVLQLLSQCLRPWSPFPLYCISFFVQSLGMAFQDSHTNTFVSGVPVAHRWLGFIHAMYALGCLVGPLIATSIAASGAAVVAEDESGTIEGQGDAWRNVYYILIGLGALNLAGVAFGFRDSLWTKRSTVMQGHNKMNSDEVTNEGDNKVAMKELLELLKVKSVWMISLFYFFELGAGYTSGGKEPATYATVIRESVGTARQENRLTTSSRMGCGIPHDCPPWRLG